MKIGLLSLLKDVTPCHVSEFTVSLPASLLNIKVPTVCSCNVCSKQKMFDKCWSCLVFASSKGQMQMCKLCLK